MSNIPTLAVLAVPLVAGEAGALVAADVVGAVGEHVAWPALAVSVVWFSLSYPMVSSPVLALIVVRHGAALAAPAIVAMALGVQTGPIDTTVTSAVQAVI